MSGDYKCRSPSLGGANSTSAKNPIAGLRGHCEPRGGEKEKEKGREG